MSTTIAQLKASADGTGPRVEATLFIEADSGQKFTLANVDVAKAQPKFVEFDNASNIKMRLVLTKSILAAPRCLLILLHEGSGRARRRRERH